jgi:hypothetical protein
VLSEWFRYNQHRVVSSAVLVLLSSSSSLPTYDAVPFIACTSCCTLAGMSILRGVSKSRELNPVL